MPALSRFLGETPRAKLIEALVRLGQIPFTRGELAREAGLFRGTGNRVIRDLEREGLIRLVTSGKRPIYRANPDSAQLDLFASLGSALELVELGNLSRAEVQSVVSATMHPIVQALRSVTSMASPAMSSPIGLQRASTMQSMTANAQRFALQEALQ
jgi:DNA-binding IclR family transcriptional regulator